VPGSIGFVLNDMNTNPAHNKEILIFLLSSIGLIVLPHVYHLHWGVFGYFCFLLAWRFIGIWKPERLPTFPVIVLLIVIGMAILYLQHRGFLGRDGGTSLFVIALGLKLMEIKSERDLYLINYLAFIVAASQFLYEQSILMAAYILFVTCVLLAVLVYINSVVASTSVSLKKAAVIVAQAIPMAIVVFILFPRVEAPRWLLFNDDHQAKMGLSDSMEPGSITDLGMSDELVFRVKFSGAIPPSKQRYWRGPVLTQTNGKKWTQASDLSYQKHLDKLSFEGTPYQYTLMMEPQEKNWVFALDMPAKFPQLLRLNANYQLITTDNLDKRSEFKLTSYPGYNTGYLTKIEFKDARQLPGAPSEKIKQLVAQLHGFDSKPDVFINQLLNHFRKEDFHYTLTPPLMEDNPIETFLFETRYGFCSHYASAFVYLMRVANIPARVVTGYQGGEWNAVGNFLEIKQADAHAWAEVWIENQGWVRFDPTAAIAPERIEKNIDIASLVPGGLISYAAPGVGAQAAFNWLKQARQLWSNIDYNWQRWVINYNNTNQSSFLSSFGIADFKTMVYWMMGMVAFITAILSLFLLYRRPKPIDPVLVTYNRFLKKIAKVGCVKKLGEGARDFAERIKPYLPEQVEQIDDITTAFIELRYGRKPTGGFLKELERLVNSFKVQRKSKFIL
jgi:protein-glutamine gamma-glutamyltransferase